jgi:hypothetical protein
MPADVIGTGALHTMTELISRLGDAWPEALPHEFLLGPDQAMHPQMDALLARLLSTGVVLENNAGVLLHPDFADLPKNRTLLARSIYLKLISSNPPYWVRKLRRGIVACKGFNRDDLQVFRELMLTPSETMSEDLNAIEFWSELQALAWQEHNRQIEAVNAEQGRTAERLALDHEFQRTGHKATWVAVLDANAGYDVRSRRSATDERELMIEVKSTRAAAIVVTRGEAKKAQEHPDDYLFYVYNMLETPPLLSIVAAEEMLRHMPEDSGDGAWVSFQVPTASLGR